MSFSRRAHWLTVVLFIYVIGAQFLLPMLSPLRILQLAEPAVVRQILNPAVAILVVVAWGVSVVAPMTRFQYAMLFVILQAAVVGGMSVIHTGDIRAYLSHLFQICSAYLLFGAGFRGGLYVKPVLYKRAAWFSVVGYFIATGVTIWVLGSGNVGRFYSPSYALMPAIAYFSAYSSTLPLWASVIGVLFSNKRGMALASLVMLFLNYFFPKSSQRHLLGYRRSMALVGSALFCFLLLIFATQIDQNEVEKYSPVAKAISISMLRVADTVVNKDEKDLDTISAGRVEEVDAALSTLSPVSLLIGNGAGWSVELPYQAADAVQNIHFSPLSITCVFGLPFAILVYLYVLYEGISALRNKCYADNPVPRLAGLYVIGALIHSFTAYSMFVDLFFFYFLGLLARYRYASLSDAMRSQ